MAQAIHYHEYALKSRAALNARSDRRAHRGVLLRIGDGFGCVHPWPELGDAGVEEQLEALRRAEPTPLIARAYRCAGLDGLARREGRSLFEGLEIPESHALVNDVEGMAAAREEGFAIVKLKCGADLEGEQERLCAGGEGLRVRLDFNETLDEASFLEWWGGLGEEARGRVDFVEDPFPYSAEAWERVAREGVARLAVDREVGKASGGGYEVAVVKPAVDDVEAVLGREIGREMGRGAGIVFTSYLDHPLGTMYAALEAAIARRELGEKVLTCGLLTHAVFENDMFVERVASEGPRLAAPGGTGLGFDDLLESIPWKLLK